MEDPKTTPRDENHDADPKDSRVEEDELLTLFRLLTRDPPPDHDFTTCPICKEYGITEI